MTKQSSKRRMTVFCAAVLVVFAFSPTRLFSAEYFSYSEIVMAKCDHITGKTFREVAAEIREPYMMMYLCEGAGMIWPVRGEAVTADGAVPLQTPFKNNANAIAAGKLLEEFNIWFSTDTQFGMRVANYTKTDISKILVGFKNGNCGQVAYEKLMTLTFNKIPSGNERVVKWRIPPDITTVVTPACMDILGAE